MFGASHVVDLMRRRNVMVNPDMPVLVDPAEPVNKFETLTGVHLL
jgi:hypothetical protein